MNAAHVEERTTCVSRVSWAAIQRLRAEAARGETARKAPHLVVVPPPTKARVNAAPRTKAAPFVPPYLRKGYWSGSPLLGSDLHAHMRAEMGRPAAIRKCPAELGRLLKTPEWAGSQVDDPTPAEMDRLGAMFCSEAEAATNRALLAKSKAAKATAQARADAFTSKAARVAEARRVVHPSGAVLLWMPT